MPFITSIWITRYKIFTLYGYMYWPLWTVQHNNWTEQNSWKELVHNNYIILSKIRTKANQFIYNSQSSYWYISNVQCFLIPKLLCTWSYEWFTHKSVHIQLYKWGPLLLNWWHQPEIYQAAQLVFVFSDFRSPLIIYVVKLWFQDGSCCYNHYWFWLDYCSKALSAITHSDHIV